MPATLDNPVHLNGRHESARPNPRANPGANAAPLPPASSASPPQPTIPPAPEVESTQTEIVNQPAVGLSPEDEFQLFRDFLDPNIDQFRLCELHGLRPCQLIAWFNSEKTQSRLAEQTALAEARARHCATMAQPKAVATLEHILDSYNDAERNELVDDGKTPRIAVRGLRQRHRESARRAAGIILRMTGAIPTHLRAAAKAARDPDNHESAERPWPRPSTGEAAPITSTIPDDPHHHHGPHGPDGPRPPHAPHKSHEPHEPHEHPGPHEPHAAHESHPTHPHSSGAPHRSTGEAQTSSSPSSRRQRAPDTENHKSTIENPLHPSGP